MWVEVPVITLMLIAVAVLAIVATTVFIPRLYRHLGSVEPFCTNCGYLLKHLPGNVCPECGTDASVASVFGPRRKLRWFLFVHCLAIAVGISAGGLAVLQHMPHRIQWTWKDRMEPFSSSYESIEISAIMREWAMPQCISQPRPKLLRSSLSR